MEDIHTGNAHTEDGQSRTLNHNMGGRRIRTLSNDGKMTLYVADRRSRTLDISNTWWLRWILLGLCYLLREAGGAEKGGLLVPIGLNKTHLSQVLNGCPVHLEMSVHLPEQLLPLSLSLSEHFTYSHIPVYVKEGGHWVPVPHNDNEVSSNHPCFYQDLSLDAGFSIVFDGDIHKIRGVFHTSTTSYTVRPGPDPSLPQGLHSVHTKQTYESYKTQNRIRERLRRQTKTAYTVELLAVVDFPIFKRWFTLSKADQVSERDRQATDMIKYYYTHLIHEVDLRYRSIDASDYTMNIVLSGIYIAKSATSLPWEEALVENRNGSRPALKASKVLDEMETWVTQFTTNLQYDHIMLFTGYDVYDISNGRNIYNKIGSAYLEGICRLRNRISVVEDNSDFTAALTAAHELGHNLGAGHDGEGNICDSEDQFVMAAIVESRTDENIFRFSSCSIQAFRSQAIRLNRALSNCLVDEARSYNQTAVDSYLTQPPGQRYSVSDQCKLIYGDKSYFCGGQDNVPQICEKLVCYKPEEDACYILGGRPAFRGTSCGNKKWCSGGKCIPSDQAPSKPENCTFGDTLTGVLVSGQRLSCQELVQQHPDLCYEKDLLDLCCGSCAAIRDNERPSCPYGDRTQGCTGLSREVCLTQYNLCCGWCKRYETGIPGCRFGDTRNWCPTLARHQCYLPDGALCCETCHNYRVNITNCEYGDKITGCNPGLCSESYYKRNCCFTCRDPTTTSTTTTSRTTPSTTPSTTPTSTTSDTNVQGRSTTTTPIVFTSGAQGAHKGVMAKIAVIYAIVVIFVFRL